LVMLGLNGKTASLSTRPAARRAKKVVFVFYAVITNATKFHIFSFPRLLSSFRPTKGRGIAC
jgi:hypothetical protein